MANNYMMQPINPGPSFTDTMQMVNGINQMRDRKTAMQMAEQQAAAAQAQAAAQAEEQARVKEEFSTALEEAHNNPTAENRLKLADIHAVYNPEKAKAFRENWNTFTAEKQQVILQDAAGALAALEASPEYGIKVFQESAEAAKNAGNMAEAKKYQSLIDMVNIGPVGLQTAKDSLTMTVGMMPGGKEAIEGIAKLGEEKRAAEAEPTVQKKRLADIGYTDAQINKTMAEARKLGIEADKLLLDIEDMKKKLPDAVDLSADAEKIVNNSVVEAAKANALATQYTTLSKDFEKGISNVGTAAKISEQIVKLFGTEKEPTALRQEYLRLRNSQVLEMLPPGAASERDVELALASFPSETSSPENITKFLKNMAKWKSYEGAIESSKAEWVQQNGTLGTAKASMKVGNREVPKGARFTEFIQDYVPNTSVLGAGGAAGATYGVTGSSAPAPANNQPVVKADF